MTTPRTRVFACTACGRKQSYPGHVDNVSCTAVDPAAPDAPRCLGTMWPT